MQRELLPWLSLLAALLCACDPAPGVGERPGFGDAGRDDAGPSPTIPAYAVVSGDYSATAISLLNYQGELIGDNYINSGSTPSGLVTTISGDVSVPTLSGEQGVLVILDRYKTDVITRIRLSDGALLGQVKTHTPPGPGTVTSYSSNPQDYVYLDEHTAWVSRYEPNLDPQIAAIDRGTDLLRIDPSTMQRTQDRIDLSPLNTTGTRIDPDTKQEEVVDVFARPTRMVRLGDHLVVGLARLAFDFSAAGAGAVALVDLNAKTATPIAMEGLTNCDAVAPVADRSDAVIVGCGGFWQGDRRATAGLAIVSVSQGQATIEQLWKAAEHPDLALAVDGPVSLGGTRVGAVATGNIQTTPSTSDAFIVMDLADSSQQELFRIEDAFAIGSGSFDLKRGLLLIPDASVNHDGRPTAGIRRYLLEAGGTLRELPVVPVATSTTLPVREVRPL